jgi:signal transduction histidine kinase
MARRELQRVAHMTQQTLGLHREMGAASSVDLRKIADSVLNLYGPKLENKDIRVETRYFATAPVFAVEAEVRQILANLISNSIDALPHKGCIHLRIAAPSMLDEDRPAVRITIADNGSGIDPQHLKQVFEPFFSTKETTGTGLGLWVAQELVRKHDGKIKARSTPGQGTVFQIFLPIERRSPLRLSEDRRDLNAKAS